MNYLRVRGEYNMHREHDDGESELPPRARRIRPNVQRDVRVIGTTSACAENTIRRQIHSDRSTELPPRARRILLFCRYRRQKGGTTSACAENTPHGYLAHPRSGNYLRVRGEYLAGVTLTAPPLELPPRARRIPSKVFSSSSVKGTTSACAENTITCSMPRKL